MKLIAIAITTTNRIQTHHVFKNSGIRTRRSWPWADVPSAPKALGWQLLFWNLSCSSNDTLGPPQALRHTTPKSKQHSQKRKREQKHRLHSHLCCPPLGPALSLCVFGPEEQVAGRQRKDSRSTATFTFTLPAAWIGRVPVHACAYTARM